MCPVCARAVICSWQKLQHGGLPTYCVIKPPAAMRGFKVSWGCWHLFHQLFHSWNREALWIHAEQRIKLRLHHAGCCGRRLRAPRHVEHWDGVLIRRLRRHVTRNRQAAAGEQAGSRSHVSMMRRHAEEHVRLFSLTACWHGDCSASYHLAQRCLVFRAARRDQGAGHRPRLDGRQRRLQTAKQTSHEVMESKACTALFCAGLDATCMAISKRPAMLLRSTPLLNKVWAACVGTVLPETGRRRGTAGCCGCPRGRAAGGPASHSRAATAPGHSHQRAA